MSTSIWRSRAACRTEIMELSASIVARTMLCGLVEPRLLVRMSVIPAHSSTARTGPPAMTPVPVAAGLGLKLLVQRPRPEFLLIGPETAGSSFPSGHALFAALLGGVLVLLVEDWVRPWWLRRALLGAAVLMALVVGASRVYLGAHWPSDVLGGYLAGALALVGLMWLRERLPMGGA